MSKFDWDIVQVFLRLDIKELQGKKNMIKQIIYRLIYFVCLILFLFFVSIKDINYKYIYIGVAVSTIVKGIIFMMSFFIYNRRIEIFNILPISYGNAFAFVIIDMIVNTFLKILFPTIIAVDIFLYIKKSISGLFLLKTVINSVFIFVIFLLLALVLVICTVVKNRIGCIFNSLLVIMFIFAILKDMNSIVVNGTIAIFMYKKVYKVFENNFGKLVTRKKRVKSASRGMINREFTRFFSDKILVINCLVLVVFSIVMYGNMVINNTYNYVTAALCIFIPLLNTPTSYLISYEKERIQLLKSLPISFITILRNKLILILSIQFTETLCLTSIMYGAKVIDIKYFVCALLTSIFWSIEKLLLDLLEPVIQFEHTEELLRNPRKYKMYLLSIGCMMPLIFASEFSLKLDVILIIGMNAIMIACIQFLQKKNNIYMS